MHLSEIGVTSEPFEDDVQIKIINNIHKFIHRHTWSIDKIRSQNIDFTIQVLVSRGDYALFYLLGEGNLTSAPFSLFLDSTKDTGVMSRKR